MRNQRNATLVVVVGPAIWIRGPAELRHRRQQRCVAAGLGDRSQVDDHLTRAAGGRATASVQCGSIEVLRPEPVHRALIHHQLTGRAVADDIVESARRRRATAPVRLRPQGRGLPTRDRHRTQRLDLGVLLDEIHGRVVDGDCREWVDHRIPQVRRQRRVRERAERDALEVGALQHENIRRGGGYITDGRVGVDERGALGADRLIQVQKLEAVAQHHQPARRGRRDLEGPIRVVEPWVVHDRSITAGGRKAVDPLRLRSGVAAGAVECECDERVGLRRNDRRARPPSARRPRPRRWSRSSGCRRARSPSHSSNRAPRRGSAHHHRTRRCPARCRRGPVCCKRASRSQRPSVSKPMDAEGLP